MHVRTITPDDFPALRAFDMHPLPPIADGVLQLFTMWCGPLSFVLTNPEGGIGGVTLAMQSADRRTVLLHYLVVAPPLRGQGHGDRLLRAVERAAADHGAERIALFTGRAGSYYEGHGYREAPDMVRGETKAYNLAHRGGSYFVKPLPAEAHGEHSSW